MNWKMDSWRGFPIKQQPIYGDLSQLKTTEEMLSKMPPIVSADEAESLKSDLALVCDGKAFLLQGGDCAESFAEFSEENIKKYFTTILQMTFALMYGTGKPVIKIGRIAGQFAKPRSSNIEIQNGREIVAYRGDIVNSSEFDDEKRVANPERMLQAYYQSAATLNFIRSMCSSGGYASLTNISHFNDKFADNIENSESKSKIRNITDRINEYIRFLGACGLESSGLLQINSVKFYISHEALLLNYEQAFTKYDEIMKKYYDLSAHFLWIGNRTRGLNDAHIEFTRGIANPLGMKISGDVDCDELLKILDVLNPQNEKGRITLISRMGMNEIGKSLPKVVERLKSEGRNAIWSCDPMHGNTIKSSNNYKTRKFSDILQEIKSFFEIHKSCGTNAGGVHLEMTGQDVTECLGGIQKILELDLQNRYHTHCDPRLNATQSIELAFMLAEVLRG